MAILFVLKGADEGKRFELTDGVVTIGRDANNACRLHDTEASRRHAEVQTLPEGGHKLIDLGSSNGTFVNQQPVTEVTLQPGDQVQIGQTQLVYLAVQDSPSRTDLAEQINMISRTNHEAPSAIRKTVSGGEGSRLLAHPDRAGGPWLRSALANLSVMYQVSQASSHILDTDQLLDRIMDLIFETIRADRGCIMLKTGDGNVFTPKAVRYRSGVDREEKITISRSIMEHVLKEQQGVLVSDAAHDRRFGAAESVHGYGIREALCVPMRGRHETLGVLYLDTQIKHQEAGTGLENIFTDDHLMLAVAIGHQAALALEETRYYQAMVQAERLAAVGQTIAAISHHIKNILQGLRSGSELLQMGLNDENRELLHHGAKVVEKNQRRIYDLVMDMLSYSKERDPALEATHLVDLIDDVMEMVAARVKHAGITAEVRCDPHLPPILVDPEGMHRALLNVVSNAVDAVDGVENATVSVQAQLDHSGQWITIIVSDNGSGIPPEKQAEIFRPFVSTKGSRGTGLGLPVSRKILREHGGDLLVQSQPGKGSKFIFRLPAQFPRTPEAHLTLRKTMLSEAPAAEE